MNIPCTGYKIFLKALSFCQLIIKIFQESEDNYPVLTEFFALDFIALLEEDEYHLWLIGWVGGFNVGLEQC